MQKRMTLYKLNVSKNVLGPIDVNEIRFVTQQGKIETSQKYLFMMFIIVASRQLS